ncbi:MAG: MFS transporter [Alphaproteobacteria bacterium]
MSTGPTPAAPASLRTILTLTGASFCVGACLRITDPLLPKIAQEFAVGLGTVSIVVTAFSVAYGLFQLVYGPIGDRFGKFRLITLAMAVSALTIAAAAWAQSLGALAALRLMAGATTAAVVPTLLAYVGDVVAYEKRQAVLARILTGNLMGVVMGQSIAGVLIEFVSWRTVFLALGSAYLIVAVLLWTEFRSPRVVRTRSDAPLDPRRLARRYLGLLRESNPRAILSMIFLEGFLFFGAFPFTGSYLRHDFGLDYATIGLMLGGFGVGGMCYSLFAGWFVPTFGEVGLLRVGGGLLVCGFAGLAAATVWWMTIPLIVMLGLGLFMVHNTLQTNATQMAPDARGLAVSAFAFCLFAGQAAGVAVVGLAIDRTDHEPVFIAVGVAMLVASWLFAARRR